MNYSLLWVNSAGSQGEENSDSLDICTPTSDYGRKPDGIMTGNIIYINKNNIQFKNEKLMIYGDIINIVIILS